MTEGPNSEWLKLSRRHGRRNRGLEVSGESLVDQHLPHADHLAAVVDEEIDGHLKKEGQVVETEDSKQSVSMSHNFDTGAIDTALQLRPSNGFSMKD